MTNSENNSLFKQPSAWIPLAMSFVALAMIFVYVSMSGIVHNQDEGTPAHIFQLIMIAQFPIAGYFAIKWLPKQPKQSLTVLAVQAVAWIIPIVTIIYLESLYSFHMYVVARAAFFPPEAISCLIWGLLRRRSAPPRNDILAFRSKDIYLIHKHIH